MPGTLSAPAFFWLPVIGGELFPPIPSSGSGHLADHTTSQLIFIAGRNADVQACGHQSEDERRDRPAGSVGTQGPSQDLRDLLRRTHAGVVDRDSGPLRWRNYVSPLRPSCAARVSSDHESPPAHGILGTGTGLRR